MSMFKVSLNYGLAINIDSWMNVNLPANLGFFEKIGGWIVGVFTNIAFWYFVFAFIIKSIVVLFFNYYTRKKFLFTNK